MGKKYVGINLVPKWRAWHNKYCYIARVEELQENEVIFKPIPPLDHKYQPKEELPSDEPKQEYECYNCGYQHYNYDKQKAIDDVCFKAFGGIKPKETLTEKFSKHLKEINIRTIVTNPNILSSMLADIAKDHHNEMARSIIEAEMKEQGMVCLDEVLECFDRYFGEALADGCKGCMNTIRKGLENML